MGSPDWIRWRGRGVTLDCPSGWTMVDDGSDTTMPVALAVAASASGPGFTPTVVITHDRLEAGMTLSSWASLTAEVLGQTLAGFRLIDIQDNQMAGQPAIFRIACCAFRWWPLVMAQFLWLEDDGRRGVTATMTLSNADYGQRGEELMAIVQMSHGIDQAHDLEDRPG